LRFVELFAGIGGFSLGFERAGMECVGHVEIDPYAQKVLLKHWPDVPLISDVTKVNGDEFGQVDLLCGGFPCQDISTVGKQGGIHGERSGLYDEIIRIARVCRPRFIVLENVANLIARPEWIGYVLGRLSEIGYDAEWEIIRASDVGAPHRRARVWIVAYPQHSPDNTVKRQAGKENGIQEICGETGRSGMFAGTSGDTEVLANPDGIRRGFSRRPECKSLNVKQSGKNVANTVSKRLDGGKEERDRVEKRQIYQNKPNNGNGIWGETARCDSVAGWWAVEPDVGRVAHGVPARTHRLKCLGNALVPQIAEFIGRQIMDIT